METLDNEFNGYDTGVVKFQSPRNFKKSLENGMEGGTNGGWRGPSVSNNIDDSQDDRDTDSPKIHNGKKNVYNRNIEQGNIRAIVSLAIPALGSVLADPLMSLVDTACVGQISSVQLAALGPNTAIFNLIFQIFQFLGVATANIIATNSPWATGISANEKRSRLLRASGLVSHAMSFSVLVGVLLAAAMEFLGPWLFILVGANQEIIPNALQFLRIRALATPGVLLCSAAWGVCIGQQDAWTPLIVYIIGGIVNLFVDLYLVLHIRVGIKGAAFATTVAQYVCTFMFLGYLNRQYKWGKSVGMLWVGMPRWSELKPFMGVASALILRTAFTMSALTAVSTAATMLGTIQTAAHQVALQIFWFLVFVPEPLSLSAQSLIARDIDNSVKVKTLAMTLLEAGILCGVVLAVVLWIVYTFGLSLFTNDPLVRVAIAPLLYPSMTAILICSIVMMVDGISIGCCDFGYLPQTNLIAAVLTTAMLLFGHWKQRGLEFVWWSLTVFFGMRLTLHIRYHLFHWKKSPFGLFVRDKTAG